MPRRIWEKVSRAVTSDNAGLAILGTTALVRAVSYAPWFVNTDRTPAHWLEGLLPAPAWSIVWLIIAVACISAIITPRLLPIVTRRGGISYAAPDMGKGFSRGQDRKSVV